MHLTQNNVGHGLVGFYIIYDPLVDAQLPPKEFDIFLVAGQHMVQDSVAGGSSPISKNLV